MGWPGVLAQASLRELDRVLVSRRDGAVDEIVALGISPREAAANIADTVDDATRAF